MKKKIIWSILIIILTGGSIAVWYGYKAYNEKPPTAEEVSTDGHVTAEEIMQEFISNPEEAGKKYHEKAIEITGTISEMQSEDENNLSISLETSATDELGINRSVRVTIIPKMTDLVKNCKLGQNVILKGIFNGFDTDLIFNMGVLVEQTKK
jgi:hypothetical protein